MEFEWDERKAIGNLRKHGVDFADAALVLEDDLALTLRDADARTEERWITMGQDPMQRVLVVVYTWRGERIRPPGRQPARSGAATRQGYEKRIRL